MPTDNTFRLHAVIGTNHGTEDADFRGDKFIGHDQGDEHRTLIEIDNLTDEQASTLLPVALELNKAMSTIPGAELAHAELGTLLGKDFFLRAGIWNKQVPLHSVA